MESQDLIAIETMFQQCLQCLIVHHIANGYSLHMRAPPNTGSHFTNNAVIFLIVYRIMRDLLVMVAFRHGLRPIGGNNGASLPALLMLGSLHQTN